MDKNTDKPPNETAPLLRVFGDSLAGRVAALIRAKPLLMARLIMAPPSAVHAIGAFLHLAPDARLADAEVAEIINSTDPRELLSAALPGCSPRLYRALDRAGDRVRGRNFYMRIGGLLAGPFADALLDASSIDDGRLAYLEALSFMDPEVAAIFATMKDSYQADAADSLVAFLRAYNTKSPRA